MPSASGEMGCGEFERELPRPGPVLSADFSDRSGLRAERAGPLLARTCSDGGWRIHEDGQDSRDRGRLGQ
jgi:hypothetical protein